MEARQKIFDWSKTQPGWRRDLLRRVATREIDDQGCLEVLDLVLADHGLAPSAPAPEPLVLNDLPEDVASDPGVLFEIGECSNVNAIASSDPLTFEPTEITLVYGENGVGKTSYSRIIKRIARAAHEEKVLPNVFKPTASPPRAVVDLQNSSGRTKHIVPLADQASPLLDSMTVFDGRCASVYLSKEKTVEFTPTPLLIFARAATAQRQIRDLLDGRIGALSSRRPSFEVFAAGTTVRTALDSLSAKTDLAELRRLATLEENEVERAAQAKLELAAAGAGASEAQARQSDREAAQLDELGASLEEVSAALSPAAETQLGDARARLGEATQAVELAREVLAAEALPGTGGDAWRRMWEAARDYVQTYCHHDFPPAQPGDLCPLCQQELAEDARARFARFDEHVRSTLEQQLAVAQADVDRAITRLGEIDPERLLAAPGYVMLRDESPDVAAAVENWVADARTRAMALRDGSEADGLVASAAEAVGNLAAHRRTIAAHQRSLIDPSLQADLQREVNEFAARELLAERLSEVEAWLTALKTIAALEEARRALDTTSLSHKQAELAKELVTDELRRTVRKELDALGFQHLKVDLTCRTDRGMTVAKMGLEGASAPLVDVLSDGEQRGCALAFFLAEALTSASRGGLALDDPATSFDVERVDHIAKRVAELGKRRQQVIVFTHNVVFAWCLQAAAEDAGVGLSVRPIARMGDRVGIVRPSQIWPGERLKARMARLRNDLQQLEAAWNKGEIDKYEGGAKAFAGDVRDAWERAVEEELFRGVVMRFQRDVKAQHIRDVEVTASLTQEVYDGMTETSPYHHEPALAKPVSTPTIAELKGFFERLERFCDSFKKKQAGASKAQTPAATGPAA
ncbi:MAG: hypothetical protein QOI62_3297 [Solirubrobacteraceae bacterium]|jgi:energy-coupling factor transporter ATP-binding protein EcfA2|nr:hypothetical protein [Solirubrobacteraceae bacterium]